MDPNSSAPRRSDPESPDVAHCDFSVATFRATAVTSCGSRLIRVVGTGLCPGRGWALTLSAADSGRPAESDGRLHLHLVEHAPPRMSGHDAIPTEVEAIVEDSAADELVIEFGWRHPIVVPIRDLRPPGTRAERGELARAGV